MPPKITFRVCIQKFSRKVFDDLYDDKIRFPLAYLPNFQPVDLTGRRGET
jgi:hypothetical protein